VADGFVPYEPPLGYIDLSKRRVSAEDIQKCEEKFNKSKAVRGRRMRRVAYWHRAG